MRNDVHMNIPEQDILSKLLKWWKVDELRFVGKLEKNKSGSFFNEVLANSRPLKYPDKLGNVSIFCPNGQDLKANNYYEFYCCLAPLKFRNEKGNPYLLNVDASKNIVPVEDYELTEISNEYFIKDIFNIRGLTPDDAARTARQLRLNELELYTQTERFIFELIQNADDMPKSKSGVLVDFILTKDFFVFLHDGLPFERDHVDAISDAGKSTKSGDKNKIGYKGIGFKSVFSDAQTVYIHSGYFSFRFDKDYFKDIKFRDLYEYEIKGLNETRKIEFFSRYNSREKKLTSIDSIPWQIKPIWTPLNKYPDELRGIQDFFRKEVSIALKIGKATIQNKDYNNILKTLFSEPRFLLFLRNVRNISISTEEMGMEVNILRSGYLKTITCKDISGAENFKDEYITDKGQYQINIDNKTFEEIGVPLLIHSEGDKFTFKKKDGADLNNIPEKLAQLDTTTLSFASKIEDEKIVKLSNNEAILFNYLPTNDSRYGFPFLVNADFITTTNRETIIAENLWNIYLFYYIGYYSIQWIADTALIRVTDKKKENLKNSILGLLPKKQTDTKEIHKFFNKGMQLAIEKTPFIPSEYNRTLLKPNVAVLDKTKIFKKQMFYENFKQLFPKGDIVSYDLLYTTEKLCNKDDYGFEVKIFDKEDIYRLFQLDDFKPKVSVEHNASLIRLLKSNKIVDALKEFPSIPNQHGELKQPEELFIYADSDDRKCISFDQELDFINDDFEVIAKKNSGIKEILLSDLGVKKFRPARFIQSILSKHQNINRYIEEKDINLGFWRFIFKYKSSLSEDDTKKLQNFLVITTNNSRTPLKECYLSSKFQTTYEIEEVANQIGLNDLTFVSTIYAHGDKEINDYTKLFNQCGVKRSEGLELYRNEVKSLISAKKITTDNYMVITKFVFNVFIKNRSKFNQSERNVLRELPLLTEDNELKIATSCIFRNPQISSILPEYKLDNQVSESYQSSINSSSRQEWKDFLLATGVEELSETDIVKRKLEKILADLNSVDDKKALTIWKFIFSYSDIIFDDSGVFKRKLKEMPLLLKDGYLKNLSDEIIYLSSEFKPKSKIEDLLDGYHDYFVSPDLAEKESDFPKWRTLLTDVGVLEVLASSGSGNNFEISHIEEHLTDYKFAIRFWKYFQDNFLVSEINDNSKFKKSIIEMPCIPCQDKEMRKPNEVYPNTPKYCSEINDETKISAVDFNDEVIKFLGINTDIEKLEKDDSYLKYLGNLGEKFVYEEFKKEYSPQGDLKESDLGFSIEKEGKILIEVIWNNKLVITADTNTSDDSGNPYDFLIKGLEETKYIEVKTTFQTKNTFMMPKSEWNWMLENRDTYYIYRVNNVTENPLVSVKCLAIDALLSGKIKPNEFPVSITINGN